ncbi:MAG: response regulator [Desulfobacteraceae bacterium]|jgi:DNA-binding response OmpR family regulator
MNQKQKLTGKRILIVDDEVDILEALKELLPMCHVKEAETFEEAERLLHQETFDLTILDIMGVRGYELLEIANKNDVITVMLTANALTPENLDRSRKGGAAYFVPKEKISEIETYLTDVLEAQEKGKNLWSRWLERFEDYFDRKFGGDWKEKHYMSFR